MKQDVRKADKVVELYIKLSGTNNDEYFSRDNIGIICAALESHSIPYVIYNESELGASYLVSTVHSALLIHVLCRNKALDEVLFFLKLKGLDIGCESRFREHIHYSYVSLTPDYSRMHLLYDS